MQKEPASGDVLIVGAGPVGMALAAELLTHGVRPTVISRLRRISPHSRATILWPRVLELLDRTGVGAGLVAAGHYFDQMNYYSGKRRIGLIRFDRLRGVTYPFAITIPQWRTEQLLENHLAALGMTIEYEHRFIDGRQDGRKVHCRLIDPAGQEYTRSFDYVVGADGHASAVRECFGFGFDGRTLRTRLAITDGELIGERSSSEAAYYLTRTGNMVVAPLGDGIFRVGASVPPGYNRDDVPREFFQKLLDERVPGGLRLGRMNFSGIFTAHVRAASRYRNDRVFLCGDAAHAMSPSGAQGLNTGLQDAANLGWKLAGVVRGRYEPEVLDTYDPERRSAVRAVSDFSTRLATIGLYSRRRDIAARDVAYRIGSATGLLERHMSPRLAQIDTHYGPGKSRGRRLADGARVPLGWTGSHIAPVLAADRFTVLLWPGAAYRHEPWTAFAEKVRDALPEVAVRNLAGRPAGPLLPRLSRTATALIVRPDGHLLTSVPISENAYDHAAGAVHDVVRTVVRPSAPHPDSTTSIGATIPMTQRVTLTPVDDMTPEQRDVYDKFPSNLTRALLLTRGSAAPHLALGASFTKGLLSDLDREVIVLRVAKLRDSAFERLLHLHLAYKAGLTEADIHAIEDGDYDRMPTGRAALVRYVTECIDQHKAGELAFRALREFYSQNEIAEVTHLAGHAAMTAMYLASLDIPLDEHLTSWDRLADVQGAPR